jgi:hypothetical protein
LARKAVLSPNSKAEDAPDSAGSSPRRDQGPRLEGAALVERVIEIVESYPGRPRDVDGSSGGLIEFPPGKRPIIIGDLHANLEHLRRILAHDSNLADLEAGRAALVLVGDAVHDDRTGHMLEMGGSVEILDAIFRLMVEHPGLVYYLRGNHDTFDERLRKSGIAQGREFRLALERSKGPEYAAAVGRFFEALPVFVIGQGFVVTHAGPPRGGLSRDEIVGIRRYPEKYHQLLWNRVNEFHGNPSLKEYGEKEVRLVLELLDLPADTHFIVGHNPLWNDGNRTGVWLDVIGIKNHHIIQSGYGSRAPYFTFRDGKLVVELTLPLEPEVYNYG